MLASSTQRFPTSPEVRRAVGQVLREDLVQRHRQGQRLALRDLSSHHAMHLEIGEHAGSPAQMPMGRRPLGGRRRDVVVCEELVQQLLGE